MVVFQQNSILPIGTSIGGDFDFSTTQEMLIEWDVDNDGLITFIDFNHPNNSINAD